MQIEEWQKYLPFVFKEGLTGNRRYIDTVTSGGGLLQVDEK